MLDYHELYLESMFSLKTQEIVDFQLQLIDPVTFLYLFERFSIIADVVLLADLFEAFRDVSIRNYRLDPSHYISAPQLSWDAMFYRTGCTLTLIAEPAMFKMLDANLRGGGGLAHFNPLCKSQQQISGQALQCQQTNKLYYVLGRKQPLWLGLESAYAGRGFLLGARR